MKNDLFLSQMKNTYDSLNYFSIINNQLVLKTDKEYRIPFTNVNLSMLNYNVFLLNPIDIFYICYMLELLNYNNLSKNEEEFIAYYTNNYIKINDQALANEFVDKNLFYCISIPINYAYDTQFSNKPLSLIVRNIINKHTENIANGKSKQKSLVLTKNGLPSIIADDQEISFLSKDGFSMIVFVITLILLTAIYITLFVIKN